MDRTQYQQLNKDILQFMMEEKKQLHEHEGDKVANEPAEGGLEQPSESIANGDNDFDMFGDLENDDDFPIETTPDENNLLNQCKVEMEAYLADQGIKLREEHNKKKSMIL